MKCRFVIIFDIFLVVFEKLETSLNNTRTQVISKLFTSQEMVSLFFHIFQLFSHSLL